MPMIGCDSWSCAHKALSSIASNVRLGTGPSQSQKQQLLGGLNAQARFEALVDGWSSQKFGKNVIVMAGAGISVSAGFPDFRDKEHGVYAKIQEQHGMSRPEDIFTHEAYTCNPRPLCMWLKEFLAVRDAALPTTTHLFLKILEQKGCLLRCYTQNIDGLELAAGLARDKIVMAHGDMSTPRCVSCAKKEAVVQFEKKIQAGHVPKCEHCGAPVRPDIVFFQEPTRIPPNHNEDFEKCDLLIVIGTSLSVNPFAHLAASVPVSCPRLLINRDKIQITSCRHSSRQLDFDSPKAYRDVWLGGCCDDSVRNLVTQLRWSSDLHNLETKFRGASDSRHYMNSTTSSVEKLSCPSFALDSTASTWSCGRSDASGDGVYMLDQDGDWRVDGCSTSETSSLEEASSKPESRLCLSGGSVARMMPDSSKARLEGYLGG